MSFFLQTTDFWTNWNMSQFEGVQHVCAHGVFSNQLKLVIMRVSEF